MISNIAKMFQQGGPFMLHITLILFVLLGYIFFLIIDLLFSKKDMTFSWKGLFIVSLPSTTYGLIGFLIGYIQTTSAVIAADPMQQELLKASGIEMALYPLYYGLLVSFLTFLSQLVVYSKSRKKRNLSKFVPLSSRILALNVDWFLMLNIILIITLISQLIFIINSSLILPVYIAMNNALGLLKTNPFLIFIPAFFIFYDAIFHRFQRATIGQALYDIRVISNNETYENISLIRAIIRAFVKYVIGIFCFIVIFFNKKGRGVHDLISGSVVTYK